ncbi:histone deacetylase family protein [Fretibacter rubidus]|uniref:histone deacetylase family protein n=1 Tax=Fretibacter rubidus TaxID=570162 RepID=UPI00352B7225
MDIVYTDDHALHAPALELHRGAFVPAHEGTHRLDKLLAGLSRAGLTNFITPEPCDMSAIARVHTADYLHFLQTAWSRWQAAGYSGDVLPMSYPHRPRRAEPPIDIDGAAGYFCSSSDTVITQTSWHGLKAVADCAVAAADSVSASGGAAFTLTRPPGHHAGADYMSGYCLLNYAAIAAQRLRDKGAGKVAILDVDFHHGNGTQDIFYARDDVFFTSIHGEPDHHFPYFWGHEDEVGEGAGKGFTANYPLPAGTPYPVWREALEHALTRIQDFGADALVVSLGVDTYEQDPISTFKLTTPDYPDYGAKIGTLNLPTVFIMEGGYGVPEIGDNTAGVLTGFMGG